MMKDIEALVNNWEKHCVATTDLDGPLTLFARDNLIKRIAELLATRNSVVHSEPEIAKMPKKRGRPAKCQSLQSPTP
jgi:hypothetical protein